MRWQRLRTSSAKRWPCVGRGSSVFVTLVIPSCAAAATQAGNTLAPTGSDGGSCPRRYRPSTPLTSKPRRSEARRFCTHWAVSPCSGSQRSSRRSEGSGAIALHSRYAIQLSIDSPSGLRVRFSRTGEWQSCAAALVPSRAVHSIYVNECDWSSVLFIELETAAGRALAARLQGRLEVLPQERVAPLLKRLEHAWRIANE